MADEPRYRCVATLRGHTGSVRRRRPVKQSVRAIRGAGQFSRHPAKRPHRVRVERYAQGVAEVDRRVPPDADRAHGLGTAPASRQTKRPSNQGRAGQLRRCPPERPRRVRLARLHAQGVGFFERRVPPHADRAHELGAAPASSRTARSIARRRREGRRSGASPPCRTAASCPDRSTARSRCGTC